MRTVRVRTAALLAALSAAVAYYAGWAYWQPGAPAPTYAKKAEPIPGGLRLEVRPTAPKEVKVVAPAPKRAKVRGVGAVRIEPAPKPDAPCACGPVDIDFTAYETPEGQPGVAATSPNGKVVDGWFTPVFKDEKPARPGVLAIGGAPGGVSVMYGRDFGPFWIAGQAVYHEELRGAAFLHVGVRTR